MINLGYFAFCSTVYTFGNEDAISPTPFLPRLRVASLHEDTCPQMQNMIHVTTARGHFEFWAGVCIAFFLPRSYRTAVCASGSFHTVPSMRSQKVEKGWEKFACPLMTVLAIAPIYTTTNFSWSFVVIKIFYAPLNPSSGDGYHDSRHHCPSANAAGSTGIDILHGRRRF